MFYGFAPPPLFPQINILAYKSNGVLGNGTATAGALTLCNANLSFKSNGMHRMSGDATFNPTWFAVATDPDLYDEPTVQVNGRCWW
ncbi:MAG: hypothetical protein ACM3XM_06745 [Mycobacterium leprae]